MSAVSLSAVSIRIVCHGTVLYEAEFNGSATSPPRQAVAAGPGTWKNFVLINVARKRRPLNTAFVYFLLLPIGVYAFTGRHDGAEMAATVANGAYDELASALRVTACALLY